MGGHINVTLDPEYADKLACLAARMRVQEGIPQARRGQGMPLDDLV